ncbi:hypothetical protein BGZ65_003719, partial [Modicella reniformis]
MIGHFVARHSEALPELDADEIRDNIYFDSMADQETQLHIFNYQLPILIHDSHVSQEYDEVESTQHEESTANENEEKRVERFKKKPVKLIIIDSITNNFRSEFNISAATDQTGHPGNNHNSGFRSSILQRSADICEIGLRLRSLADQFGMAVVCVNQVTDVIRPESASMASTVYTYEGSSVFPALDDPMSLKKPALGLVWENTINARVILQRTRLPERQGSEVYPEATA